MTILDRFRGEPARLIPTLSDSKREEKATSVLLAAFRVIPGLAREVLGEAGAKIGSRATIECFTEVVFKQDAGKNLRPDGLIVVQSGRKEWCALVESKVGTASLGTEQVESYLKLAKELGIDALITISNEFAVLPTHHPTRVNKAILRKVELYHFSWLSVITKAVLATENSVVTDPEQAFILAELIRYLKSSNSGTSILTKMDAGWKDVCDLVQQKAPLISNQVAVEGAVSSWHQLMRYLSLELSMATSSAVSLEMPKKLQNDAEEKLRVNISKLTNEQLLSASFNVPNAAANINITADFRLRTVCFAMRLQAPQDIKRPTAAVNWLTRQLKYVQDKDGIAIRVHWPKRTRLTMCSLAQAIDGPERLVPDGCKDIPKELEIWVVVDLAGRFRGSKTFIEEIERGLHQFYTQVGQRLSKWQPKAPQIKNEVNTNTSDRERFHGLYGKVVEAQVEDDKTDILALKFVPPENYQEDEPDTTDDSDRNRFQTDQPLVD